MSFGPSVRNGLGIGLGPTATLSTAFSQATLDFDFIDNLVFPTDITFTRASSATYFNSAGVLTTAATNVPRLDYNPATLAPRGLLIEEQRVNSIRNNTMQGTVAGTPGTLPTNWSTSGFTGLTRQIVGTGVFQGVNYIDVRFSGTSSTTFGNINLEGVGAIAAVNGQTWSQSTYLQIVAGTAAGVPSISLSAQQRDAATAYLSDTTNGTLSATVGTAWQRVSRTNTTTNAATAFITPYIQIALTNGAAIDITLRIGLPQLELGAFATSVIPTTTTATTRSADVASVNTLSPWYNAAEGTIYVDFAGRQAGTQPYLTMLSNTGETERIYQRYVGAQYQTIARVAGVDIAFVYNSAEGSAVNAKIASAYNASQLATSTNGQAVTGFAVASLSSVPSGLNRLWLGSFAGTSSFANGYLRRITYYPSRLSNAQLQALTA